VRRTHPLSRGEAWRRARQLVVDDPALGQIRSETPGVVLRAGYDVTGSSRESATLQLRVIDAARGTTVSIHIERLPTAAAREALRDLWRERLEALA